MQILQWGRFSVTVFSEVRFSITEIFVVKLLENENIIRICTIPHSSHHSFTPDLSFAEVAVQRLWGPSPEASFACVMDMFI